jgi:CBS domain containing-hemolysin-like protein
MGRIDLTKTIGELNLMRKVLFVPPSMMASGLMARMQATHIQMALVIDEYGGTDGLASLEDIVEMVVGDIEDEHDDEEIMIAEEADGVFVVDARADLEELTQKIGPSFEVGEHGEDVDTVGGLIFSVLGRIPVRGEVVQAIPGYEFHVLEVDPRRVKRVRIVPLSEADRRRQLRAVTTPKTDEGVSDSTPETTEASKEA